MNLLTLSLLGLGAWLWLSKKPTTPALGTPTAAPVPSSTAVAPGNSTGADEQVALAIARGNPNQMRLVAAQLRAAGFTSQASTLENTATGLQITQTGGGIVQELKNIL